MSRRNLIPAFFALVFSICPLTVLADVPKKVTWQDIVRAIDKHPQIIAGQFNTKAADAAVDAAGAIPNPSIEATSAIDNSDLNVKWGLALSIPLGWINQRSARIGAARAEADASDAKEKNLRRDVLLELRILFWTVVYDQERIKALEELNSQMLALVKTVQKRVDKGEVRPVEAVRVEVEAEKIAGELEVAGLKLETSRNQLSTWLGIPDGQLMAVANLSQLPSPITGQISEERAAEHPTMTVANAQVQALEANVTVERRARVPSFEVKIFTDHEVDSSALGIGLAIDVPIWNWNTGNIRNSEHLLEAEKKNTLARRLELENQVMEAQSRCQAGVTLARRYNDRILPRAKSAMSTIERTYELGEATLLEVIDARQTWLEIKNQFLGTLAQTQIECSRLYSIAGEELP